jgi:hypothetical protein
MGARESLRTLKQKGKMKIWNFMVLGVVDERDIIVFICLGYGVM